MSSAKRLFKSIWINFKMKIHGWLLVKGYLKIIAIIIVANILIRIGKVAIRNVFKLRYTCHRLIRHQNAVKKHYQDFLIMCLPMWFILFPL